MQLRPPDQIQIYPDTFGRAARAAASMKPVSCHKLRHSLATHLVQSGADPVQRKCGTVQELLCHASVETPMIYTHVIYKGARGVRSPLDLAGVGGPRVMGGVAVPANRLAEARAAYAMSNPGEATRPSPSTASLPRPVTRTTRPSAWRA